MLLILAQALVLCPTNVRSTAPPDVRCGVQTVRAGGRTYRCNVVTLRLSARRLVPRVVIATGGIGRTEAFEAMVQETHAVAAINGSFFDAYNQVGDKDPNMTLIRNGEVIHKGSSGTVIGFGLRGAVMGRLELPIRGTVESRGRVVPWAAYWINRTPQSADNIAIFTPARGARARIIDGISVVVENNTVVRIVQGDTAIPTLGYVINFRGDQARAASAFTHGAKVGFHITLRADTDNAAWQTVSEAVGAGPRLLRQGRAAVDAAGEGFLDPKILTSAGRRSAIGVTRNGDVLLVTVGGATVRQLAEVMRLLGAYDAMNLDGGASSGLYGSGAFLTHPGRPLSNVLVFVRP